MNRARILSQITEGTEGTVKHGETETNRSARATSPQRGERCQPIVTDTNLMRSQACVCDDRLTSQAAGYAGRWSHASVALRCAVSLCEPVSSVILRCLARARNTSIEYSNPIASAANSHDCSGRVMYA